MAYKDILKIIPTVQSASLVSGLMKKEKKGSKTLKKPLKDFTNIIVGTELIKETAKFTK